MLTITKLHRAVLEALDVMERGGGDTEVLGELLFSDTCLLPHEIAAASVTRETVCTALYELLLDGLVEARLKEWPLDANVSIDPIIYSITDAGCEALWALMRAEAMHVPAADSYARPVVFETRTAMVDYCGRPA